MDIQYVAEIFTASPGEERGVRGTGYLIAPGLVLTALHVAAPALTGGNCEVRFFDPTGGQTGWIAAKVAWQSMTNDAALLAPAGTEPFRADAPPVTFGRLSGNRLVQVDAVGFAEAMTRKNEQTDTLRVAGSCDPLTAFKEKKLVIQSEYAAPQRKEGWKGESGAAVFAGDVLVGIIEEYTTAFGSQVLRAVPISALAPDETFATVIRTGGGSLELFEVTAFYVNSLPDIGWEEVRQKYCAETVRALGRFEISGLSIEGASGERALAAEQAYHDFRFRVDADPPQTRRLKDLLNLPAAVILGRPGSGKSGTLKMLLWLTAQTRGITSVLLPLSSLAALPEVTAAAMVEMIARQATSRLGVTEASELFFWRELQAGRCVVLFDALDEVYPRAQREKIVLAVRDLAERAPRSRYYLTSRPSEYADTPIPGLAAAGGIAFQRVEIEDLDTAQIEAYFRVWFDEVTARRVLDRADLLQLHPGPLLLNIMGSLARRGELPQGLFRLFDAFVQTALVDWEERRGADPEAPAVNVRREALEKVAWAALETEEREGLLNEESAAKAAGAAKGMVDGETALRWLAKRTGLLQQHRQLGARAERTTYQFAHEQILEFLAGCELARRLSADFRLSYDAYSERFFEPKWESVLRFSACRLEQGGEKHNLLLRRVLKMDERGSLQRMIASFLRKGINGTLAGAKERFEDATHLAAALLEECDTAFVEDEIGRRVVENLVALGKGLAAKRYRGVYLGAIFTLDERGYAAAGEVVEQFSLDRETRAALADSFAATEWQVQAVEHLARKKASSARKALDLAMTEVAEIDKLVRLAGCLAALGEGEAARARLRGWFDMRRESEVTAEVRPFLLILRTLAASGFQAEGLILARAGLAEGGPNPFLGLECALWLHERGEANTEDVFRAGLAMLPRAPREELLAEDALNDAVELALPAWEQGNTAAEALVCAAMANPRYAWYYARDLWQREDAVGEAARRGMETAVFETSDRSRRNGYLYLLGQDENEERASATAVRLLEDPRVLRWGGYMLLQGLEERGKQAPALAALRRIEADPGMGKETREDARQLLERFAEK